MRGISSSKSDIEITSPVTETTQWEIDRTPSSLFVVASFVLLPSQSLTSLAELELDSLFLQEAFPAAKEHTSSLSLKACEVFSYSLLVADVHPLVAAVRLTQKSSFFLLPNQTGFSLIWQIT